MRDGEYARLKVKYERRRDEIKALAKRGMSLALIAKAYDISRQRVYQIVRDK